MVHTKFGAFIHFVTVLQKIDAKPLDYVADTSYYVTPGELQCTQYGIPQQHHASTFQSTSP